MKKVIFLLMILCNAVAGFSQHHLTPSLYIRDMNFLNPASLPIDSTSNYYASVLGKRKFVDNEEEIWSKPASVLVNFAGRTRNRNGLYTVGYLSDQYSYFRRNGIYAGYIRQVPLGKASLDFSIRGVFNVDAVDFGKLKIPTLETGTKTRLTPDVDLGAAFRSGGFTAGAAVHNALESATRVGNVDAVRNFRAFVFHSAYEFSIGKPVKVTPYALVRIKRNIVVDAGLQTSFFNRFNLSYSLRLNELRGIYAAEIRLSRKLFLGIAFDRSVLYPDHNGDFLVRYQW